jgi:hypothetical protein
MFLRLLDDVQDMHNEFEVIMELQPTNHLEAIDQESIQIFTNSSNQNTVPLNCFKNENLLLPQFEKNEDENILIILCAKVKKAATKKLKRRNMLKPEEEKRNLETWKKNVRVQKIAAGEE